MEGWDGTNAGRPTELTQRRWRRFGRGGAKLIWGGEAVALRADGRANPNQLLLTEEIASRFGCSARGVDRRTSAMSRPRGRPPCRIAIDAFRPVRPACEHGRLEPIILYRHPVLDRKFRVADGQAVLTDDEIARLVDDFVRPRGAQRAGFDFIDVKHCHGYLGHDLHLAVDRPGRYGGNFENRTRFLREVVGRRPRRGRRVWRSGFASAVDWIPFRAGPDERGEPEPWSGGDYRYAFGGDGSGVGADLTEPYAFLDLLESLGIQLVCITVGSPYYNPHIQRPALFPPSDGYLPPEDPLIGVARQIAVTADLKRYAPNLAVVGSGYSYLQEWLPHVGQAVVRTGAADFIGLGRMALSYPEMPADVLAGRPLRRKQICRTFSDCTTAPRNGMVSGCYPLDPFYKGREEAVRLAILKR